MLGQWLAATRRHSTASLYSHKHSLVSQSLHRQRQFTNTWQLSSKRAFTSSHYAQTAERVRNIGIIAHIDAGKTTTTERMLHYAGFTRKLGDVDSGSTVMDYLPAERSRGITIQSAAITFGWRDAQVHLIDTPGHVDFTVEVERAMRVLDGAVAIIDAVAGVQAQTLTVWRQTSAYGIPCIVFVNKMDREGADWQRAVKDVEQRLGTRALVLVEPEIEKLAQGKYEPSELRYWVDAVTMERIEYDASDKTGATVRRQLLTPEDGRAYEVAARARERLVETLAELDAEIVDEFLAVDGDHVRVSTRAVRAAVRRATLSNMACPVVLGAAFRNVGVQPLLDAVIDYLPSPTERPQPKAISGSQKLNESREISDSRKTKSPASRNALTNDDKLVAFAFKVTVDAQRGPMVFVRVYSGSLDARMTLVNGTRGGIRERASKLLQMYADSSEEIRTIRAGHIGVVLGLKHTRTGDTLLHPDHTSLDDATVVAGRERSAMHMLTEEDVREPVGLQLHGINVPPPVFMCAVEADSPKDENPLAQALASLLLEDPSLSVSFDAETGQTVLRGMGELHLEIVRDRLRASVNVTFGTMRVSFREAPSCTGSARFDYDKDIAGRPSRAGLRVEIEPHDRNANNVFVEMPDELVAVNNPAMVAFPWLHTSIRRSIWDGVHNALLRGTLLGFAVVRAKVRVSDIVYYGHYPSTPAAYRACAAQAVFQALAQCSPQLLEPLARAVIQCPANHVGAVLSDINGSRMGRVLSLDDSDDVRGSKSIVAQVPLSAMIGYSSALRSLTAGSGTFSMHVEDYGPTTKQQRDQILKDSLGY
ncbi:Ribosome-releasing factor 2, mitochondrial [Coemansia sp. RSA 1935]|nr:Ribosome-releasing factor 2, mitochondrial [Coemansia sp. RSA 564]KAJ2219940.1 Ribosome-releasing factor 2, mitochondrial [Coemansia sp. RSA 520]KAJ2405368.1 Ribosome-releasing factor 2, mitochondrial [Coemansia sp. RSA 2526]KAJ2536231.1 Ribosome-releasing factor 2, mitochondrial [Coemansia sp. RSA 1935]